MPDLPEKLAAPKVKVTLCGAENGRLLRGLRADLERERNGTVSYAQVIELALQRLAAERRNEL